MFKFLASIKKEYYQLINDKVGLLLMFLLPLLLVLIITIVQDSAFKIVNENKISILVVNHDNGEQGAKLVKLIDESEMLELEVDNEVLQTNMKNELLERSKQVALYIPAQFSEKLNNKAKSISHRMMKDLGLADTANSDVIAIETVPLDFYHDPVLQDNYCYSLMSVVYAFLDAIENTLMIESVYSEVGIEQQPQKLKDIIVSNRTTINKISATKEDFDIIPNSTQHNVPAWTIFAMFFMVISLGGNIVKERISGSFVRLKTMPTSFSMVLISKMIIYLIVAILQVTLIFSVGVFVFPYINLPVLSIPSNIFPLAVFVMVCSMAAVSFALMIGSIAKTQEQSNGIGAISVIIFAALGGIWVPTFVMPDYMQIISNISPLQWCLEGFYILFLKGGNWNELSKVILTLLSFIVVCQFVSYYKLRIEKVI